jgi:hypothetical protein
LVEGDWPAAEEVAEECIVKEVTQWWSRQDGEEEVLCERCYVEHLDASRAKRRKLLGGDKVVSSREYQNRTTLNSGYYTKQSWVSSKFQGAIALIFLSLFSPKLLPPQYSENPSCERCSSCKLYMRPIDLEKEKKKN